MGDLANLIVMLLLALTLGITLIVVLRRQRHVLDAHQVSLGTLRTATDSLGAVSANLAVWLESRENALDNIVAELRLLRRDTNKVADQAQQHRTLLQQEFREVLSIMQQIEREMKARFPASHRGHSGNGDD